MILIPTFVVRSPNRPSRCWRDDAGDEEKTSRLICDRTPTRLSTPLIGLPLPATFSQSSPRVKVGAPASAFPTFESTN